MGLKGQSVLAGRTTAAFIKFNYTEETSNLDNKMREAALVLGFFSMLEETAVLAITTARRKI